MNWVTLTPQKWPWSQALCMFNYDQFLIKCELHIWRNIEIRFFNMLELELSKMTLSDLGPEALVSRNICYQQHQFLIRGLEDMSLNGQNNRWTQQQQLAPQNFSGSIQIFMSWNEFTAIQKCGRHYYKQKNVEMFVYRDADNINTNNTIILQYNISKVTFINFWGAGVLIDNYNLHPRFPLGCFIPNLTNNGGIVTVKEEIFMWNSFLLYFWLHQNHKNKTIVKC
jgi:hypothetical protein